MYSQTKPTLDNQLHGNEGEISVFSVGQLLPNPLGLNNSNDDWIRCHNLTRKLLSDWLWLGEWGEVRSKDSWHFSFFFFPCFLSFSFQNLNLWTIEQRICSPLNPWSFEKPSLWVLSALWSPTSWWGVTFSMPLLPLTEKGWTADFSKHAWSYIWIYKDSEISIWTLKRIKRKKTWVQYFVSNNVMIHNLKKKKKTIFL